MSQIRAETHKTVVEVITQENNTSDLTRKFVRSGVAGNFEIILEMVRVIRNSTDYDIGIERLSKDLLKNNNLNSYAPVVNQLTVIYNFVRSNVEYTLDKAGLIESIKSARVTLSDGYGDCDDHTVLNATLAGCLGFEDVRIAMAKYSKDDTAFSHVYCVVYNKDQRYVLDTTLPDGELNKEILAYEVKEIPVFKNVEGFDGLSGAFYNTKHYGKKIGQAMIEAIPAATQFLPLGFVPGNAFATGAAMLSSSGTQTLSLNATGSKINQELDSIIKSLMHSRIALDMAQATALQVSSQLSAVERTADDTDVYQTVRKSVAIKLAFIRDFETYAKEHNIKVVRLDARLILFAGLAGIGFGGYTLYKIVKGGN